MTSKCLKCPTSFEGTESWSICRQCRRRYKRSTAIKYTEVVNVGIIPVDEQATL
jgi:hypothetical protein